jgi:hypothetical protein
MSDSQAEYYAKLILKSASIIRVDKWGFGVKF